jgi:hypothetical protein
LGDFAVQAPNVTEFGASSFAYLPLLTSIEIPRNVTKLATLSLSGLKANVSFQSGSLLRIIDNYAFESSQGV